MAVIVGTSSDLAPTGLAGRIATAIKAVFTSTTYPAGSIGVKGIDAMAQGIVDAINNDKIDLSTQATGSVSGTFEEVTPSPAADGVILIFTLAHIPKNLVLLDVFVEGVRYTNGVEYTYSLVGGITPTLTFVAGMAPLAGRPFRARYPF